MLIAGRYELGRRIADGGMASVWEARDAVLDRTVAVKVVDLGGADPTLGERLQREAVAAAALSHPDVVTVHDAGVQDRTAYVVMALVPGRDLGRVVAEEGPLPVAEAARIGARVAGALAAAHAAGIVHRDVKPGNVMVDGDRVTVVDFGIASMEGAAAGLTAAGTVVGTAHTMAPEQASGRATSPATDVYSLGCLLTTLLTGAPPFEAETPLAVLQRHVSDPPQGLRARRPDVPAALEATVLAMLAKDPAARPSATDVRDALAAVAGPGTPGHAAPTTPTAPLPPTQVMPAQVMPTQVVPTPAPAATAPRHPAARRRRGTWAPIAVLGVLAVVALAALASSLGESPGQGTAQAAGVAPTAAATGDGAATEPSSPEPPAEPPPTDVAGLLAAIAAQDPDAARDLGDRWAAVTRELEKEDERKAADRMRDLHRRLDELVEEGRLGGPTADAVRTATVAESGVTPTTDEGRGPGRDGPGDGPGGGPGDGPGRGRGD